MFTFVKTMPKRIASDECKQSSSNWARGATVTTHQPQEKAKHIGEQHQQKKLDSEAFTEAALHNIDVLHSPTRDFVNYDDITRSSKTLPARGHRHPWRARKLTKRPMLASLPQVALDTLRRQLSLPKHLGKPPEFANLVLAINSYPILNGERNWPDKTIWMALK